MQNQEWQGRSVLRGGRRLYNCCKELWLGGQRNNQLKALMASDGVAVQGRWNQRLGLQLEWEVPLTVGLELGLAVRLCGMCGCASAANNGAMASVISCNCFPSFMTISSASFASVCVSPSPFPFGFPWPNEACKFQACRTFLPPALLSTFLSQSHE